MPAVPVTSLLLRTRCFFPSGGQSHSQYPLLTTHRGMAQAESIWVPSVSRWFTRLETVTHPGTNRALQASSNYVDRVQRVTTTPLVAGTLLFRSGDLEQFTS